LTVGSARGAVSALLPIGCLGIADRLAEPLGWAGPRHDQHSRSHAGLDGIASGVVLLGPTGGLILIAVAFHLRAGDRRHLPTPGLMLAHSVAVPVLHLVR